MKAIMCVLGLLLAATFWSIVAAGSACQDIDHDACVAMTKQNPNICSDQILAKTACPSLCKQCPVTCYNCNSTTSDVSQCNTMTCANGEMCLLKTVHVAGNADMYSMMCGPQMICSYGRKRNQQYSDALDFQSRDTSINLKCCDSDLCNSPLQLTSTKTTTKQTTKTTMTTVSASTSASSSSLTLIQTPVTPQATQQHASCERDIIFMLDDSIPMKPYMSGMKALLADVITHLDIAPDKTRVALGIFGKVATKQWNLDSNMDTYSLLSAINQISSQHWSYTGNNLAAVELVLHSFNQGNRATVPDDVIFITEGSSPHYFSHFKEEAAIRSLHQKSNNVIVIGMGLVNQNEVQHISTDNNHYLYVQGPNDYSQQTVVSKILNLVCN